MSRLFIYTFFCLLISSQECVSQTYDWAWARCAASTGNSPSSEGMQVATDSSENLYVAGFYGYNISFGPYVLSGAPNGSFLAVYDSNGNIKWAKGDSSINASGGANTYGMCTDAYGNCYVSGGFLDTVYFDSIRLAGSRFGNAFLAKYDSSGNVLWAKSSSDTLEDYSWGVAVDVFGNSYITGKYQTSVSFGPYTLSGSLYSNIFIVKYDPSGNVLWAKSSQGIGYNNLGTAVTTDLNGNIYLTGFFDSTSISFGTQTIINPNPHWYNAFLVKYDSSGNVIWATRPVGQGVNNEGWSVTCDLSGNIFLVGVTNYPNDGFIAKYDTSGNVIWSKSVTGSGGEVSCLEVTTDKTANLYVTGGFWSTPVNIGGDTTLQQGPLDSDPMFIVKYDSSGTLLFAKALTNGGDDECGIAVTNSGSIYLGGDFTSNLFVLGNDALTYNGSGEQVFVAKLSYNNVLSDFSLINSVSDKPKIYPNPTSGHFSIYSDKITSIKIFNCLGETIYKEDNESYMQKEVNIAANKGIYFIVVSDGEREYQQKLIIE